MSDSSPRPDGGDTPFASHMPQATWTVGGAFRFDQHLVTLMEFLLSKCPPRKIMRVAGAPSCAWSLDMYGQRTPMSPDFCAHAMQTYGQLGLGVALVFDNPLLPESALDDSYGHRLMELLCSPQCNATGLNVAYVAHDGLADALSKAYPLARIICHRNRLIMEREKRTPAFYEELAKRYFRVTLHPRDAVSRELYTRLKDPWKYNVVVNDPVPRNYAARRELLQLTAAQRQKPWDYTIAEAKEKLAERSGLFSHSNTSNLTATEELALYDAGIRSFILQDFMFRNEVTLWWDLFYHIYRTTPERSNEAALIAGAAMAHIRESGDELSSGFRLFSFGKI